MSYSLKKSILTKERNNLSADIKNSRRLVHAPYEEGISNTYGFGHCDCWGLWNEWV